MIQFCIEVQEYQLSLVIHLNQVLLIIAGLDRVLSLGHCLMVSLNSHPSCASAGSLQAPQGNTIWHLGQRRLQWALPLCQMHMLHWVIWFLCGCAMTTPCKPGVHWWCDSLLVLFFVPYSYMTYIG